MLDVLPIGAVDSRLQLQPVSGVLSVRAGFTESMGLPPRERCAVRCALRTVVVGT